VTIKNAVLWDLTRCGSSKNRRFGGKYSLRHQGEKNQRDGKTVIGNKQLKHAAKYSPILFNMMEALRSSETSVLTKATRRTSHKVEFFLTIIISMLNHGIMRNDIRSACLERPYDQQQQSLYKKQAHFCPISMRLFTQSWRLHCLRNIRKQACHNKLHNVQTTQSVIFICSRLFAG
jgi:hypothetical protein